VPMASKWFKISCLKLDSDLPILRIRVLSMYRVYSSC
jgi:hypothetical protein